MISKNARRVVPSSLPRSPFRNAPHAVGITAIKFTCIPRTRAARRRPTIPRLLSPLSPLLLSGSVIFLFCHNTARKYSFTASLRSPRLPRLPRLPCIGVIIVPLRGRQGAEEGQERYFSTESERRRSLLIALSIAPRSRAQSGARHSPISRPRIELFPIAEAALAADRSIIRTNVDAGKKDSKRRNNFMDIYIYIYVGRAFPVRGIDGGTSV